VAAECGGHIASSWLFVWRQLPVRPALYAWLPTLPSNSIQSNFTSMGFKIQYIILLILNYFYSTGLLHDGSYPVNVMLGRLYHNNYAAFAFQSFNTVGKGFYLPQAVSLGFYK